MDNFYKLITVFVLSFFSSMVFADTYPAQLGYVVTGGYKLSKEEACSVVVISPRVVVVNEMICESWGVNSNNILVFKQSWNIYSGFYCPEGGSLSNSNCINAPSCGLNMARNSTGVCELTSCPVGETLNPVLHICQPALECTPPESDSGLGFCSQPECIPPMTNNIYSGMCELVPTNCAGTEHVDPVTNLCTLNKLNCPLNSHASSANDICLPDPPRGCVIGQHDDGSYNCVADDRKGCGPDERHGYINGQPACIHIAKIDRDNKAKDDAQKNLDDAKTEHQTAKQAAEAAAAALAADPTNITKQAANAAAQTALTDAAKKMADAIADLKSKHDDANAINLQAIAEGVQDSEKRAKDFERGDFGGFIDSTSTSIPVDVGTLSSSVVTVSCPSPRNLALHGSSISMSYQPYCDFARGINPLIIALAYLMGAYIILGGVKD